MLFTKQIRMSISRIKKSYQYENHHLKQPKLTSLLQKFELILEVFPPAFSDHSTLLFHRPWGDTHWFSLSVSRLCVHTKAASQTQRGPPIPPPSRVPEATLRPEPPHTVRAGNPTAQGVEDGESPVSSGNDVRPKATGDCGTWGPWGSFLGKEPFLADSAKGLRWQQTGYSFYQFYLQGLLSL